jgi:hypothetical protein
MDAPAETFSFTVLVASQADLYDSPFDFFKKKSGTGCFAPMLLQRKQAKISTYGSFQKKTVLKYTLTKAR